LTIWNTHFGTFKDHLAFFKNLVELPQIEAICWKGRSLSFDTPQAFAGKRDLPLHTFLCATDWDDDGIDLFTKACPKLVHLDLEYLRITDRGVQMIAERCPLLEELRICGYKDGTELSALGSLKRLKKVYLVDSKREKIIRNIAQFRHYVRAPATYPASPKKTKRRSASPKKANTKAAI
jgi:hypothetical protein